MGKKISYFSTGNAKLVEYKSEMDETTLLPYVWRNLLEDKSDTEEAHWGRGLDSNVEREEKREMPDNIMGHLDPDTSPTPSHSITQVKTLFHLGELEVDFYHLMPIESGSIQAYLKFKSGQFYSWCPQIFYLSQEISAIIQFLLPEIWESSLTSPFL